MHFGEQFEAAPQSHHCPHKKPPPSKPQIWLSAGTENRDGNVAVYPAGTLTDTAVWPVDRTGPQEVRWAGSGLPLTSPGGGFLDRSGLLLLRRRIEHTVRNQ